jgi:hypothetical protein
MSDSRPTLTKIDDTYGPSGAEREWTVVIYVFTAERVIVESINETIQAEDEAEAKQLTAAIVAAAEEAHPGQRVQLASGCPRRTRQAWGVNLSVDGALRSHRLLANSYSEAAELAPLVAAAQQQELPEQEVRLLGVEFLAARTFEEATKVRAEAQRESLGH